MAAPAATTSASTSRWRCSPSPQIAVCHFGLFRDLTHTLPSLRANVHAALERQLGGVDVFVHALLVSRLVNARSAEDATLDPQLFFGLAPACRYAAEDQDEVDHRLATRRTRTGKHKPAFSGAKLSASERGFDLASTSLRLGSAYAYPTHVDCYENVIFQLRGRKNVTVYPPATVWDLQPDINHKHWPTGSPQEMARAARDAVTVELEPGDALYVPLMWPHSVQSIDASVTSNKYLYVAEGWLEYINRAKTAPWLVYEMERGGLC